MKAAILPRTGPPDVFQIIDVPVPECGPGDVLVEVMASGVSSRDIAERNGTYRRDVVLPLIIGLEIAGIVRAVGNQVTSLEVGDHIATKAFSSCGTCRYCRTGRETTCLDRQPVRGGYGQFTALAEDACVKIPDSIPFEAACSLGPAAGVAMNAVRDTARVSMGETVLVSGASSGVGLFAVQLAALAGAHVIALSRDRAKVDFLRGLGAQEVVVIGENGKFAHQVLAATDGEGVDVVIDNVGSAVFWECFQSLALHGRYAVVGEVVGKRIEVNLARIFFKRAQLLGVGSVSRVQLGDVAALCAEGKLRPQIDSVLPLEQVADAHQRVEKGQASGRVILSLNTAVKIAGT